MMVIVYYTCPVPTIHHTSTLYNYSKSLPQCHPCFPSFIGGFSEPEKAPAHTQFQSQHSSCGWTVAHAQRPYFWPRHGAGRQPLQIHFTSTVRWRGWSGIRAPSLWPFISRRALGSNRPPNPTQVRDTCCLESRHWPRTARGASPPHGARRQLPCVQRLRTELGYSADDHAVELGVTL